MTREEAIKILEEEAEFLYGGNEPYNKIAFNMAIEALSAEAEEAVLNKMLEEGMIVLPQDYVKVVRCKDCKWYDKGENEVSTWSICTRMMGIKDSVMDTDYCSFAELREDGEA